MLKDLTTDKIKAHTVIPHATAVKPEQVWWNVVDKAINGYALVLLETLVVATLLVTQPAAGAGAVIPKEALFQAVTGVEFAPAFTGSLYDERVRGADLGLVWDSVNNSYRLNANDVNWDDIPVTGGQAPATQYTRVINFRIRHAVRFWGAAFAQRTGLPLFLLGDQDCYTFKIAAQNVFDAISAAATLDSVDLVLQPELVAVAPAKLPCPMFLRHSAEQPAKADFTLGPYRDPGGDIVHAFLAGDILGLGPLAGGDGIDNVTALKIGIEFPKLPTDQAFRRFLRHRRMMTDWTPIQDLAGGTGALDPEQAVVLPLVYVRPIPGAHPDDIRRDDHGVYVDLDLTAPATLRVLTQSLDRPSDSMTNQYLAARQAAFGV
jgi:hypothetical protein